MDKTKEKTDPQETTTETIHGAKKEGRVMYISQGGSTLELDDGSKWKIAHYFKKEVFDYWRHGDSVTIREASDDPLHPFIIYNTEEQLEVAAQQLRKKTKD